MTSAPTTLRVMTVCTGNICRSPMAEVVLRDALVRAGLADRVRLDSSGTSDEEHGNPIDSRAQQVLTEAGYEVPRHRARQVTTSDAQQVDVALAMTAQHARRLRQVGFPAERVVMFRAFEHGVPDGDPSSASAPDAPDPWYGDMADFRETLATVEACVPGVVAYLRARMPQ
ncbi:low molecular weight protein-tyrosine-phosphatase [Serinibacter salmoneus]|uniref:protein-tyrosine-phosphatase n=1 Tax=Serinibacter salmoneus TaxID=556530 RepID=A0A2A9D4Y3_9MICO|nr:low molecular weight protein-tyrosine-phosphatase [Serinibacter salmoneus]PFG21315.1 protein-tyrosine phosphatase [Serinibacter salmoneus]